MANSEEALEELGKREWVFNDDTQEWEEIIIPPTYISVFEFKQLFRKKFNTYTMICYAKIYFMYSLLTNLIANAKDCLY